MNPPSPLWLVADKLVVWRHNRKPLSWRKIPKRLKDEEGITLSWPTIYQFYKRLKRKAKQNEDKVNSNNNNAAINLRQ
jgi:hypothetical protein